MTDLRDAVRALRAAPSFTIVALVVLTLGIGATTAIFSVVDAVALRALPFDEHDRLVAVGERRPPGPRDTNYDPHALMSIATSQAPGVIHASLIYGGLPLGRGNWSTDIKIPGKELTKGDDIINARIVTPDYHRALGIPLRSGRLFEASDRGGVEPVLIINESAARKYFPGEDPIGRSVTFSNEDRTIVGIVGDVHQASLETDPRTEGYVPLAQVQNLRGGSDLVIRASADPTTCCRRSNPS